MRRWHLGGSAKGHERIQKDMASPRFPEFKGNYALSCPFVTPIRLLRNQQVPPTPRLRRTGGGSNPPAGSIVNEIPSTNYEQ